MKTSKRVAGTYLLTHGSGENTVRTVLALAGPTMLENLMDTAVDEGGGPA